MQIKLIIPGKPIADCRPRGTIRYDKDKKPYIVYYDQRAKEKKAFRYQVQSIIGNDPFFPMQGALSLHLLFLMPRPRSHYGTGQNCAALKPSAPRFHIVKPDTDNLEKFTLDCLNKVVWNDDAQVVSTFSEKIYGPEPRTIIRISSMEACKGKLFGGHKP